MTVSAVIKPFGLYLNSQPFEGGIEARQAAVGNKVDDMLNASSDEEWNKMMEAYNKALQNNPV